MAARGGRTVLWPSCGECERSLGTDEGVERERASLASLGAAAGEVWCVRTEESFEGRLSACHFVSTHCYT